VFGFLDAARPQDAEVKAAEALRNEGRYDAVEAYKNSIAILSRLPGERIHLASMLNNVATLFEDQKRYGDAEKLLQQALAIYRAALGENHLYVATACSNLGSLYEKAGDLARAEMMMLSANQVMLQVFDGDHPRRVTVLRNLGSFYAGRKDWRKAAAYYREALGILQKESERTIRSRQGELAGQSLTPASRELRRGTSSTRRCISSCRTRARALR
jgi:tetratricopeptide (TPR) repeat protein